MSPVDCKDSFPNLRGFHTFHLLNFEGEETIIAGCQLHFKPNDVYWPHTYEQPPFTIFAARHLTDPIAHLLEPQYPSVQEKDLLLFATGFRIFQYGEVELICAGDPELLLHCDDWPLTIGGLEYYVTQESAACKVPTTTSHLIPCGANVSSTGTIQSRGCLGMKIVGPDGLTSITASTHAFVSHSTPILAQKLRASFLAVPRLL
ncbi:hypothetical protein GGX14DRAFT_385958 [Mycena pura]|uniref:Uncharacterized protein n=1 Tax=Mycena pura TaxID=153505 RepID=A0AAD7E4L3_9AGAR|nr:hypothetical protein GGX14DRAFT_385958 [Mycena pura]